MTARIRPEELVCSHCGRPVRIGANRWQHRYVCATCYSHGLETYGVCAGCGAHRLTPGIADGGGRLCTDCAEDISDYTCTRCGREAARFAVGVCGNCVLAEELRPLLDDGTGDIRAELVPLFDAFRSMARPRVGIYWIRRPHVARNLRALARGEVPLSHDGLSQLTPWRWVAYVRDLLMEHGVLPQIDRQLVFFERWLAEWLRSIDDVGHHRLLERFATWHVLRRLRTKAAKQPLGQTSTHQDRDMLRRSEQFLAYLAEQGRGLDHCTQADIDAWHTDGPVGRRLVAAFLRWAIDQRAMPRLQIPTRYTDNPAPISRHQRLALIRRVVTDEQMALLERVVALLILLYAQPITRILRLTLDDVLRDDDGMSIRLGEPPSPVPEPFASLLNRYLAERPNLTTATNPNSRLLFPGRRAGQPIGTPAIGKRLAAAGIPTLNGRTAAIRQLLLQAPAPVVAKMLGYTAEHAEAVAAEAGGTWKSYAPGNHDR